jgi:hypothetical protein
MPDATVTELKSGWLDKAGLAAYLGLSVSWVEKRMQEGMPYAKIGSRTKFRATEAEPWLERNGWIERRGEAA